MQQVSEQTEQPKNTLPAHDFSYHQINSVYEIKAQGYISSSEEDSVFIDFYKSGISGEKIGWKIHISLIENNENIGQAWDLIVPILMRHGIEASKVLKANLHLPEYQLGKEITIYDQRSPVNWDQLLQEIHTAFVEHGIRPGYFAINDKQVEGSAYFTCRNDLNEEGDYVTAIVAGTHNLTRSHHLFENLRLSPHPQSLPKPAFSLETQDNIRRFYGLLGNNINSIGQNIKQNFSQIKYSGIDIFSQRFITRMKHKYHLASVDVAGLQAALTRLSIIRRILDEGNQGISKMDQTEFKRVYSQYERELQEINTQINTEIEKIKVAISTKATAPTTISAPKLQSHQALPPPSNMDDFFASLLERVDQSPSEPQVPPSKPEESKAAMAKAPPVEKREQSPLAEHEDFRCQKQKDRGPEGGAGGPSSGTHGPSVSSTSASSPAAASPSQQNPSSTDKEATKTHQSSLPTYAAISQSLSAQPAIPATHMHISSGQEKMVVAIADATGLSDVIVEQLSSQQIQNIHRILHDSEHGSDRVSGLIISGLRAKTITLDHVKDITAEKKKELDTALAGRSTSHNLGVEDVMQALSEVSRKNITPASTGTSVISVNPSQSK